VAIDPMSKLVPVLHLGSRTQDSAHRLVHELRERLASGCLPVLRSDGLNLYFSALTAHFGQWIVGVSHRARQWQVAAGLIYGQVKKTYQRRKLVRVTQAMRCGTHATLRTALTRLRLSGRLNTAFVERINLTLRQNVAALVRRTWATMQDAPQLLLHLEWWRTLVHHPEQTARRRPAPMQSRCGSEVRILERDLEACERVTLNLGRSNAR
jgi:IS1 family transposase